MGNLLTSIKESSSKHAHRHSHRPKGPEITDSDRAVLSLKTQRRKLEDQAKLLEKRIDRALEVARELIKQQKKDRALLALKRKRITEQQLLDLQKWLINVEEILSGMEVLKQQNKLFTALKQGNEAMKKLQSEVKMEEVEKLMDDTAEAKELQNEMNALLSHSFTEDDESSVFAELEALEDELGPKEKPEEELPSVPTTKVEGKEKLSKDKVALQEQLNNKTLKESTSVESESSEEERQLEGPLAA